jgi:hypothetical protein
LRPFPEKSSILLGLGPEKEKKIFASRYKLLLPSEAELKAELLRELKFGFQSPVDPFPPPPDPPLPEIGFHVKEDAVPYRTERKVTS